MHRTEPTSEMTTSRPRSGANARTQALMRSEVGPRCRPSTRPHTSSTAAAATEPANCCGSVRSNCGYSTIGEKYRRPESVK